MLSIAVKGIKEAIKELEKDKKQMRFAGAVALTKTAKIAKDAAQKEISKVFDRPTPFTLKSGFIKPAKKDNLEARVGIKPIAAEYLAHHVHLRTREIKGAERVLRAKGLLPASMYVVPGHELRLNAYGNITKGMIKKILQSVTTRGGGYFVARIGNVAGVWQRYGRKGRKAKPVLVFVRQPKYENRFDFYGLAERTFNKHFGQEFDKALDRALSTAR